MNGASDSPVADLRDISEAELTRRCEEGFAATLDLVFAHHPYYADRFRELGLRRSDISGLRDLHRLPVTTKAEYVADPERFRMVIPDGPREMRALWDVMYTSGTSGDPAPFYSTTYDYYNILTAAWRMLRLRGVVASDVIANLNPMTIYPNGAFNRTLHAAATMGIPIVSLLPGRPSPFFRWGRHLDEVVDGIVRTRATILWGISSYIRRVAARAAELGADLSCVRLAFVSGEATTDDMRADLIAALERAGARSPFVSISYGHTETQAGLVECAHGSGLHNSWPEGFYWEVVNPETFAPVEDGQPGVALLTHLDRRGTVLLRFMIGDLVAITRERCPLCGAIGERVIDGPRRFDRRVKIKANLIDVDALQAAIENIVRPTRFQAAAEFARAGDALSGDVLRVRVEAADGDTMGRVAASIKDRFGLTPEVIAVGVAWFDDADGDKRRLFVDRRRGAS